MGVEAQWAAAYRQTIPQAHFLLHECLMAPNGRQLLMVANLRELARLVQERTAIKCQRCQYRSQVGLVDYLIRWFPTKNALLYTLQFVANNHVLPLYIYVL